MRLLSFLSDIENAIAAESPMIDGGAWESSRMVNFEKGLGRLTLAPRNPAELPLPGGVIFLQAFVLADGSECLKATLNWKETNVTSIMAVYSRPGVKWKAEATRIATTWLNGPPPEPVAEPLPTEGITPLSATG